MDANSNRIPIETAHAILATFGITKPTRAYERWCKEDGFDVADFDSVLFESPFVFVIDWRAWLQEELETIAASLQQLGVELQVDLDEDGETGRVICGESRESSVSYRPNDDSDFSEVIRVLQAVVPSSIEFRAPPHNQGSDTYVYAVLPNDEWTELDSIAPDIMSHFFQTLRGMPRTS